MIPFLVADRPASLRILRGSRLEQYDIALGLMSHANTGKQFQELFSIYPCSREGYCELAQKPCPYNRTIEKCPKGSVLRERITRMCDSGIFQKDGCSFQYAELFSIYERMKVSYGVMIDFLKEKDKTIESAKKALDEYKSGSYSFKLVGVSQGKTIEEYMECYDRLKEMGFLHVAIGGLLKKTENSARYVRVNSEQLLSDMISRVRKNYPEDWLFALGCYNPKRHKFFSEMNVFGSDYKGWIFQYDIGRGKEEGISIDRKDEPRAKRYRQTREFLQGMYQMIKDAQNNSNLQNRDLSSKLEVSPHQK